jgi:hypothetical protein
LRFFRIVNRTPQAVFSLGFFIDRASGSKRDKEQFKCLLESFNKSSNRQFDRSKVCEIPENLVLHMSQKEWIFAKFDSTM